MTHLLDTSALLAHYFDEPGSARVQALFDDAAVVTGTSILALYEFDARLQQLGRDHTSRANDVARYRDLLDEIVWVDEDVLATAMKLRAGADTRVSAMDTLIAASSSHRQAVLVHRDPHFTAFAPALLEQEMLERK